MSGSARPPDEDTPMATIRDPEPHDGHLTLRGMALADLSLAQAWLTDGVVAGWYLTGSTLEEQLERHRNCGEPTEGCELSICPVARSTN